MSNDLSLDAPTVRANIARILDKTERSQSWLARQMGVSEMWVSRRLNGQTEVALKDIEHFALGLSVSSEVLISRTS